MSVIDIAALILLPIFSLVGVYFLGQKIKTLWRKVLVLLFGYGIIALTITTTLLFRINALTGVIFRISYYPVSVELICNWITYDILPFLSLFYFSSKTNSKNNKLLITASVFVLLMFFLVSLHDCLNRPVR
jgi:hypothetical protein